MGLTKTVHPGFLIDGRTNVVINTNDRDLASYRRQVQESLKSARMEEEHERLKGELAELRAVVARLALDRG